jgi:hypothetical protein
MAIVFLVVISIQIYYLKRFLFFKFERMAPMFDQWMIDEDTLN